RNVSGSIAGVAPARAAAPALRAVRVVDGDIDVDGRADEEAWSAAEVATGFVQFEPEEGAPASERTEARVLYGERALFVHIKAFESDPSQIVGQLTRRDQGSHSDVLGVVIDSYFDRRTAFQFAVNPVGVKQDVYHFDDTNEDSGWDAVWDVAVHNDTDGWSAEFRIPYSQLRFRSDAEQTWGINFLRRLARAQELAVWSPSSRSSVAIAYRYGELQGLRYLSAPNRTYVLPFTRSCDERTHWYPDFPFSCTT